MEGVGGSGRTLVGARSSAPEDTERTRLDASRPRARPSELSAASVRRPSSTLGSTRIRIVVTYLVVLITAALVSMFAIREVLLRRLDQRTEAALRQELLEPPLLVNGVDPLTGESFQSLRRAFDVYLDRNVPSIEEAFIALVGDDVVRDRLRSFPGQTIPPDAIAGWAAFSSDSAGPDEIAGSFETARGTARFRAVRVTIGDETGAFVVTILPEAEMRGIRELQTYGALVIVLVVAAAGVCAWFLAGRVLRPVRELTETARSISESSQLERIRVGRSGEAAEMAETFNDMLDRLNAASTNQRDFLRAAGHELRAPLTVATGHLELLADGTFDQQATLPVVIDELTRMGKIIDDLESLTGATAPDFLGPELIDAELFAQELLTKAIALADRAWRLEEVTPGTFVADRFRMTEAVLNLADNAAKHTIPGATIGIGLRLVPGTAGTGGEVRVFVRDSGLGVTTDDAERIFERFTRGHGANNRYRGAGLGLSIVQSIAIAHGGRVELESRLGAGATFTIVIPLEPVRVTDGAAHAADPDR
jgi:signal transduction histidine kinase